MPAPTAAYRPAFRPDLEGLRGLAALVVVLAHAGAPGLGGGFVAVDVLFVLSGYFITGLLARELDATGTVGLGAFYAARARRLLPALAVVLAATIALVAWLWAPIDRADAAASARAAALSAANVAYARRGVDYFAARDDVLVHTWSLGVEQQAYLVWAPLLLAAGLLAGRRGARWAVATAGLASFAAAVWLTHASPVWAYYGVQARLWALALGGGLALAESAEPPAAGEASTASRARVGATLQALGLAAVAATATLYDASMPYPGVAALAPAAGTLLVIAGGRMAPAALPARVLGAAAPRWLGRVSYAWYLWHWPLVSAGRVLDPAQGVAGALAWSGLALALAWLTERFVERPGRTGRFAALSPVATSAAALVATGVLVAAATALERAGARRARRPDQRPYALAREDRMPGSCWGRDERSRPCAFGAGPGGQPATVVLFGDSHAEHWLAGLDAAGRARGWRVVSMVKGGCPVADAPELAAGRRAARARECARFREAMLRHIIAMRPAFVLLSSSDEYVRDDDAGGPGARPGRLSPAAWERGLRRTYARLAAAGVPVVAMRDTPRAPFDVPACLSRRAAGLPFARACDFPRAGAFTPAAVAAQTRAAAGLPVRFVDMGDQLCDRAGPAARCAAERGGAVAYTDDDHLTASFSRRLASVLGARVAAAAAAAAAAAGHAL